MPAQSLALLPPGGVSVPPQNTVPRPVLVTRFVLGFCPITSWAAFSALLILAMSWSTLVEHSALGQVTVGIVYSVGPVPPLPPAPPLMPVPPSPPPVTEPPAPAAA